MSTLLPIRRQIAAASDLVRFLVVCGLSVVWTTAAEAQTVRRHVTIDGQGRMASSISIQPQSTNQPKAPCSGSPFSPGQQNYHHSFASPGAQNFPTTRWPEPSTAWTQPQNPWGTGWSPEPVSVAPSVPAPQPYQTPVVSVSTSRPVGSSLTSLPVPGALPQFSGDLITIAMPDFESGECGYILRDEQNSWNYVIRPGKKQQFPQDRLWAIQFDGGVAGEQNYRLEAGVYEFRRTSSGWGLFRVQNSSPISSLASAPLAPQ